MARQAATAVEGYEQYLLRLTELEVAARSGNAAAARIRAADFPVHKDFDTFDFTAVPALTSPRCWSWHAASGSHSGPTPA